MISVLAGVGGVFIPFISAIIGGGAAVYSGVLVHRRQLRHEGLTELHRLIDHDLIGAILLVVPQPPNVYTEFAEESRMRAANLISHKADGLRDAANAYHPHFSDLLTVCVYALARSLDYCSGNLQHRPMAFSPYNERYRGEMALSVVRLAERIKTSLSFESASAIPSRRARPDSPLSQTYLLSRVYEGNNGKALALAYRDGFLADKGHAMECVQTNGRREQYSVPLVLNNLCHPSYPGGHATQYGHLY